MLQADNTERQKEKKTSTKGNDLYQSSTLILERLSGWVRIIPNWVPANLITLSRALLLIPIYFAYQASEMVWVIILFLIAWITDIIDGLHARYRKQESTFGKLLDPAVDKIFVVGLLILIAPGRLSSYLIFTTVSLEIAIVLMTLVMGPLSVYFFRRKIKLGANKYGKIKMTLQGLALAVLLVGLNSGILQQISEFTFWCAAVFAVISIVFYVKTSRKVENPEDKVSRAP
jgi:CDP-diacylglycerol--glycerol-3-phosphate 3-phosphatidyltransferase